MEPETIRDTIPSPKFPDSHRSSISLELQIDEIRRKNEELEGRLNRMSALLFTALGIEE